MGFGRTISKHRQLLDGPDLNPIIEYRDIRSVIIDVGYIGANIEGDADDVYEYIIGEIGMDV